MRNLWLAVMISACTVTTTKDGPVALRAGQEAACAAVVAPHEGVTVKAVTATWERVTPEGIAVVAVQSPGAVHTCEVDAALRVRAVEHPGH
jgi:hypothetical protein